MWNIATMTTKLMWILCFVLLGVAAFPEASDAQNRGRNLNPGTPPQALRIVQRAEANGAIVVTVDAQKKGQIFITTDGRIPRVEGGVPAPGTLPYRGPLRFLEPVIVRALHVEEDGRPGLVRGIRVVPRVWNVGLRSLPVPASDVDAVWITGAFRNWSSSPDPRWALARLPNGSFAASFPLLLREDTPFKFLVRLRNGQVIWWADPSQPQTGQPPQNNNVAPASAARLANRYINAPDGFVDEAGLDLDFAPRLALDAGTASVRFKFALLDQDASSVVLRFLDGRPPGAASRANRVSEALGVRQAVFSTVVDLNAHLRKTAFVVEAQDGERTYFIGPNGLSESLAAAQSGNFFELSFDPKSGTVNGQAAIEIPLWAADAIWYNVFPERFANGDASNDEPGRYPGKWQRALPRLMREVVARAIPWAQSWFAFTPHEQKTVDIVREEIPELTLRDIQQETVFNRRYGGDLQGLLSRIPYLKNLGVNAIYLNPVMWSDSLHKYDTIDYRHVDPRFGPLVAKGDGKFPELYPDDQRLLQNENVLDARSWGFTRADMKLVETVNALHAAGMRVVLDGVYNHSAFNSVYMRDVARRGKASPFVDWFELSFRGEPGSEKRACQLSQVLPDPENYKYAKDIFYDAWFGFCTLPNHREGFAGGSLHPALRQHIFETVDRWMRPKRIGNVTYGGIDGVRLDVYGDVAPEFWRLFRKQVKQIKPDALIVAEDWHNGFEILRGDQADSIMNYTARTVAESWFVNAHEDTRYRPSWAKAHVDFLMENHREHVKYGLWTMLSSHDTDRVFSRTIMQNRLLVKRPQDDNAWDADYSNKPDKGVSNYSNDRPGPMEKELFKAIVAFQFAYLGSPLIYYGDEVGMWGADDPTNRKAMVWEQAAPGLRFGTSGRFENRCFPTFLDPNPQRNRDIPWCLPQREGFEVAQDRDLFAFYQRVIALRKSSMALRRGLIQTNLGIRVEGAGGGWTFAGSPQSDPFFLWGFERSFANREFVYFLSNQLLARPAQTVSIKTRFPPGATALDVVSGGRFPVDADGVVTVTIARDRAVLLVRN